MLTFIKEFGCFIIVGFAVVMGAVVGILIDHYKFSMGPDLYHWCNVALGLVCTSLIVWSYFVGLRTVKRQSTNSPSN